MGRRFVIFGVIVVGIIGLIVWLLSIPVFRVSENNLGGEFKGEVREFDVVAKQWEFIPNVIEVSEGDLVKLKVKNIDVAHGIYIPEFGVNEKMGAGESIEIEFIADKTGKFDFFCNVYCGSGHKEMTGRLVVS